MVKYRVLIVGEHPWSGHSGVADYVRKPQPFLPPMAHVILDNGFECMAERKNLEMLKMEPVSDD